MRNIMSGCSPLLKLSLIIGFMCSQLDPSILKCQVISCLLAIVASIYLLIWGYKMVIF